MEGDFTAGVLEERARLRWHLEQAAKDLENGMVDSEKDSSVSWNMALKQSAAKIRALSAQELDTSNTK